MTKPMGPIPAGFTADADGMLLIGGRRADALVAEAGDTPLFVYDLGLVEAKIARFRAAFEGVHLHFAMKANPYLPLLKHVGSKVDGVDLASGGELAIAMAAGVDPAVTSFAGPGKRDADLEAAMRAGVTLNAESEGEVERALAIGTRLGIRPRLAVRVNPDFEIKGSGMRMGGGAKPFGVDAARVPALVKRIVKAGAEWRGFHIFAGSQALDAGALIEAQTATVALAAELAEAAGAEPPLVNLGGGFGIPYFHGEQALDVETIAAALAETLGKRPQVLANTEFAIELGRWLVGECGVYLTRIVDRKESHGKTFLVTDGGMQHQLAASGNFGQVVRRNYPVAIANRFGAGPESDATVVGCLCTPLDRLADDVALPDARPGDLVAVFLAGAYGLSASPQAFLAQQPAREMVVGA
ncbi:pyridoxal-dependent decarboxylase, exosortase A system-associated [Sphingosinicella sp. LHD-64]|uniref:pyridoxal-dependent decarboxylase, exosortase A system-associated n=1 Tax=Sphingosinicella sp. LHD-64 TaxID=3072139 RepID=UPI00280FCD94|nr:pyridoxal-dependent decarboxylase, exosortase A system-associated [Sphingosinicella sp. LHD-64]MDQ8754680.1 pyridoxal-dependent decarboxylase, exosortase A system-associated [Sphingosinicella sp. LHD-64]